MKRILSSLIIILIALTCIACVSASSDFNETIDNEITVPVDDVAENDIIGDGDSIEIDNQTEIEIDNQTEIEIDNSTGSIDEDNGPAVSNVTNGVSSNDKWKVWQKHAVIRPNVEVNPTTVNSGDKIFDDAVYYAEYYRAYKNAFACDLSDLFRMKSLDAVFDLVYETHTIEESIAIVSKIYCLVEFQYYVFEPLIKNVLESNMHNFIEDRFYTRYYNPDDYKYNNNRNYNTNNNKKNNEFSGGSQPWKPYNPRQPNDPHIC